MLERTSLGSDTWSLIQENKMALALQYLDLAYQILTKKIIAKPEFFNGQPVPETLKEQAAALMRFAILIEPNCDLAMFHLGTLTLSEKIQPQLSDNLGELMWSNDYSLRAALFFRRSFEKNPLQIYAYAEIGILIAKKTVVAEKNDFIDKIIPSTTAEQAAKIFRYTRTINFNYYRAISYLSSLIELGLIVAIQQDFGDEVMPEKVHDQAVKLYRLSMSKSSKCVYAISRLAIAISKELVVAIPSDFSPATMPTTIAEQAAYLFRYALSIDESCLDALVGMARLISNKQLIPEEQDCKILGISASSPAEEQAATLYRKVIKLDNVYDDAKLALAELIVERKVAPEASDIPGFHLVLTPLSFQLERMLKTVWAKTKVNDLLERAKSYEEILFQKTLVREAEARRVREEKQDQERKEQARLKLAAQELKTAASMLNPTLKRKTLTEQPPTADFKLFPPQGKKQRGEQKEHEVKDESFSLGKV